MSEMILPCEVRLGPRWVAALITRVEFSTAVVELRQIPRPRPGFV
jgi:hypothetical protein